MRPDRRGLADATVVITGASSGIGQATAEEFARRGSCVVIVARDEAALEDVAERCRNLGAEALVLPADITKSEEIAEVADRAESFGGGIDIWVSNVGTGAVGAFHEVPLDAHEQVVRTNLIGHIQDAYAALPIFLRQGHGVFINMISLGGFAATPYAAAYSASKFGLRGFGEALRGELAREPDIHVCDIYPSFVDTPGISHGANYTGRELSAPPPVLDARRVARAIVGLAGSPQPTTMVGLPTALVRLGHAISPELTTRAMARFLDAYFRRAPHAARTSGNLYQPVEDPGGVDGGLRAPTQRKVALGLAIGFVGLGLLTATLRRRG